MDFELQDAARQLVLQISAQDAVLDEDVLLRRLPLVIDVQRSASAGDRAIVDDGAQRTRHLLADAIR